MSGVPRRRWRSLSVRVGCAGVIALLVAILAPGAARAAAGDLDPTFGGDGTVTTDVAGTEDDPAAMAIDADGRIVVAGGTANGTDDDFSLVRYEPDGALDSSFGAGGTVTTPIGPEGDDARAVAIDSQGGIVAAGITFNGSDYDFALARYAPDGSLDPLFGTGGTVTTPIGSADDMAFSLAIDSQDRIVAAGLTHNGSNYDFAVARYATDGTLDPSFGTGGTVTTPIRNSDDECFAVAIDSLGRIVLAGGAWVRAGGDYDFALARYTPEGALDTSFSVNGKVTTLIEDSADLAVSVAIDDQDRIVAGGGANTDPNDTGAGVDFALARYATDGTLDGSFGTDGKTVTPVGDSQDDLSSVAIDPQGRIVAAGDSFNGVDFDYALARYGPDGNLDPSFGTGGTVTTPFGGGDDFAFSVKVDSQERIVAAGGAQGESDRDFAVARYLGDEGETGGPLPGVEVPDLPDTPELPDLIGSRPVSPGLELVGPESLLERPR